MSLYKQYTALESLSVGDVVMFGKSPELWVCANNALSIADGFNHFCFVGLNDYTNPFAFTNAGGIAGLLFCFKVGVLLPGGSVKYDVAP